MRRTHGVPVAEERDLVRAEPIEEVIAPSHLALVVLPALPEVRDRDKDGDDCAPADVERVSGHKSRRELRARAASA